MDKQEFIDRCHYGGYCRKKTAEKYIAESGKKMFDESDIEEVFRIEQNKSSRQAAHDCDNGGAKYRIYDGAKTTKHLACYGNGRDDFYEYLNDNRL